MKKLVERLLIFFLGCPLVLFLVLVLPQKNHLAMNVVVIIVSILSSLEFQQILKIKNMEISTPEAVIFGAISPLAMTLMVSFGVNDQAIPATFILMASWLLVSRVFYPPEKFPNCLSRAAAGFSVMIYPGLFLAWIIRMSLKDYSNIVILVFVFMVFANDSAGWAAGMLFGKNNRGIFPASPNKSIAGYVAGLLASSLVGLWAGLKFPLAFESSRIQSAAGAAILGFLCGLAASLGDLGESVFKRSAGVKDSGVLVPGRGGMLDCVDSIALAAPVYYVVYLFFF